MFAHKTGLVTGWGQTYTKDSCQLRVLKQTILESVVDPRCIIDKKRLCGYSLGSSVCFGDSGGPLTVNVNGKHVIVGVASYLGGNSCKTDNANVYTRVSAFLTWIRKNIIDGDCGRN